MLDNRTLLMDAAAQRDEARRSLAERDEFIARLKNELSAARERIKELETQLNQKK